MENQAVQSAQTASFQRRNCTNCCRHSNSKASEAVPQLRMRHYPNRRHSRRKQMPKCQGCCCKKCGISSKIRRNSGTDGASSFKGNHPLSKSMQKVGVLWKVRDGMFSHPITHEKSQQPLTLPSIREAYSRSAFLKSDMQEDT